MQTMELVPATMKGAELWIQAGKMDCVKIEMIHTQPDKQGRIEYLEKQDQRRTNLSLESSHHASTIHACSIEWMEWNITQLSFSSS